MSLHALNEAMGEAGRRTIPYDYRFRFELDPGRYPDGRLTDKLLKDTVTVSIESDFMAVSIGYGVIPRISRITFGAGTTQGVGSPLIALRAPFPSAQLGGVLRELAVALGEGSLAEDGRIGVRTAQALAAGIRFNPRVLRVLLNGGTPSARDLGELLETAVAPPERVQFLYALFDEATGRAFQNEPILNIAGWGIADGDRPFRQFSPPIHFAPRSTIRLEVTPKSEFAGDLQVVLHGYKVLGGAGTPTGLSRTRRHFAR